MMLVYLDTFCATTTPTLSMPVLHFEGSSPTYSILTGCYDNNIRIWNYDGK